MTPDYDDDLTATAMLIGGPQDGDTMRVPADLDTFQKVERVTDGPLLTDRRYIDVEYRWDGTIMDFGARRYRRVKP